MKIISNDEYNQAIECMNNANVALIELKTENDKLKKELEVVKNNVAKANVSGSLRANALEWFFAKSEIEKEELKDKHFSSEYIAHDSQWGFHFTFGQIEKMYVIERG